MDELLDAEEPAGTGAVVAIVELVHRSLQPAETGSAFQQKYFAAIQNHPDVVFAHRDAQQSLARARGKSLNRTTLN